MQLHQLPAFVPGSRLIARLSGFFRRSPKHALCDLTRPLLPIRFMRKTWLIGAAQFYEVLKMAADPNLTGPRRLISKCLILLRHFSQQDFILTPPLNQIAIDTTTGKSIGKHENVGIMKIGHILHDETDPGTLLVRRFGDATMSREANPTLILAC